MPLVTPGMLAAARNLGNQGLESSATISRATDEENAFGSVEVFTDIATDVPCWVRAAGVQSNLSDVAMREAVVGNFRIHFAYGTDIRPNDRITVDGETFDAIDTNAENTIAVFTTAMAKRVA